MEKILIELSFASFKYLGLFSEEDIQRASEALDVFSGRIERDNRVSPAKERYQNKYKR